MKELTDKLFGRMIAGLGLVGLLASLVLAYEKYAVALDPGRVPSCSLSPIIACESVLASGTDSLLLGIPNSFIGIAAFAALLSVGVAMMAGSKISTNFWKLFYAVVLGGVGMSVFFIYHSLYVIGALCLYCMITWAVTIALFVYSTFWLVEQGILKVPKRLRGVWPTLRRNHLGVLLIGYLIIFGLILFRFRDYFESIWF